MWHGVGGMIISPITTPIAEYAFERTGDFTGGKNAPLLYAGIHTMNMVAHIATPVYLTRMSNPNMMSYAYKGLDPLKFGMHAAIQSRKDFQMASSKAFQVGSKIGARYGTKAARLGGKFAVKAIPGVGWGMLAYDVYDLVANRRLFGIQL